MKSVVLIDGPNLMANLRTLPKFRLDYAKLMRFLKERYAPLLRVLYYDARLPANARQVRFLSVLQDLGYEVHLQEATKTGNNIVAKGFDVDIAVAMLLWADSCDRIVLVSGDSDFAPALLALPRKGVLAEVLAFRLSASRTLLRSTVQFTDLLEVVPDLELTSQAGAKASNDSETGLKTVDPEEALINRAVLAGIRLERGLRKLCAAKNQTVASDAGLDALNNRLASAGVYDKLTQKRILVWSEIRNKAAHGLAPHYTSREVHEMESWIEQFIKMHVPNRS